MDAKLLLVKCITLLYREAELSKSADSRELCRSAIATIRVPEGSVDVHSGRETIVGLRSTVEWMVDIYPEEGGYDKTQILQRSRINTRNDSYLYDAIEQGVKEPFTEEQTQKWILANRGELLDHLDRQTAQEIIAKGFHQMNFSGGEVNHREFVRDLVAKLEPFTHVARDQKHPAIVDCVDFSNTQEVARVIEQSKEEMSTDGILKTGYQAFNRMLGDHGGIRRGEFVLVGALQHNFKTGFTMNLFKQAALYNKPYLRDPKKKPLLIHFSLENELHMNTMWLYQNLVENFEERIPDTTMVDPVEAANYIHEKLSVNGYHIAMLRLKPDETSYHDLFDMITKYETEGYEVHMVVCDYLNMMSKKGLTNTGPTGSDIRDLFRRVRNFIAPRGIAFVTPHQLSTEAKMLTRQGVESFVKEIANKGYYDSCRTIDQEVDLEVAIHIEKVNGRSYLTMQRGKHRKVTPTPQKDLYCVLPFHDIGGVKDDILLEDSSSKAPGVSGSGRGSDKGNGDWFDSL